MKRFLSCLLLLALCLSFAALAEKNEGYIECECGRKRCLCFLQEGDTGLAVRGVIELLKERGYLDAKHSRLIFDKEVTKAIKAFQSDWGIGVNGVLDDMTLTLLIWDGVDVWYDENYAYYAAYTVWVPTNGGSKQHTTPYCSGMLSCCKMSALNAWALGLDPCRTCNPM